MHHRATAWLRCGRRRIVGISASTIITNNERTDRDAFDRGLIGDRCARRKIVGWNGRVNRDRDEKWKRGKLDFYARATFRPSISSFWQFLAKGGDRSCSL